MTNAEIVFNELERQNLDEATVSLQGGKVYVDGHAVLDCDALATAIEQGLWRPIETAPKSKSVLVMDQFGECHVAWQNSIGDSEEEWQWMTTGHSNWLYTLAHWCPLPPDPVEIS